MAEDSRDTPELGQRIDLGARRRSAESDVVAEGHWRDVVENPGDWWDNRLNKWSIRAPDFCHKISKHALWLDNARTPMWARDRFIVQGSE